MSFLIKNTYAHGGGLDSSGGHNCYVGSCAGTYHYHRSSSTKSNDSGEFGSIFLVLFLGFIAFIILTAFKQKAEEGKGIDKVIHFIVSLAIVLGFVILMVNVFGQ